MIYSKYISTPIIDHVTTPLKTVLKVSCGLVYKVEVDFPPGPASLLKCQIYDGGFQAWPSTPGEFFASDNFCITFDDTYLKLTDPYQFDIFTWNEDETFAHGLTVRIGMVSSELFMARFLPTYGYRELTRYLEQEKITQEKEREGVLEQPFSWVGTTEIED